MKSNIGPPGMSDRGGALWRHDNSLRVWRDTKVLIKDHGSTRRSEGVAMGMAGRG
jgi:hypothetical protein